MKVENRFLFEKIEEKEEKQLAQINALIQPKKINDLNQVW